MDLIDDLLARGLVHDTTDLDALRKRLSEGPISVYIGFDPTADSLHAGSLVGQLLLRRFQLAGHKPFPLAGGATGMVGDPGGRSEERNLLDEATLNHNVECIKAQLTKLLDFTPGPSQAVLVNNADWTKPVGVIDFLRDVGKHITVNQMMAKDSVKSRLESENGLSYTEFSYMLLQAFDFRVLFEQHGVEMQMGGSDQWGNITAGTDLIRKSLGKTAFALTHPLITKSDGTKFGKSASGAVWLDPERTSPYQFRQFWVTIDDADIEKLLLMLSLRPVGDIKGLMAAHNEAPHLRSAQKALATEMTTMVHGAAAAATAEAAADVLFGSDPAEASAEVLEAVFKEIPTVKGDPAWLADMTTLVVETGLEASRGAARRTLTQNGVRVNSHIVSFESILEFPSSLLRGRFLLVKRGKNTFKGVVFDNAHLQGS
jgi:tyrosyl-tRNA synthetase